MRWHTLCTQPSDVVAALDTASPVLFGTQGNLLSFLARTKPPDPPARTRLVCERYGAKTPHDAFDDSGYGWYAQMWRYPSRLGNA
jgi:hypothetical protein